MKFIKLSAVIISAVFLAGCGNLNKPTSAQRPLTNTLWKLIELDKEAVKSQKGYEITFNTEGRANGIGECNRFMASYELNDAKKNSIKIGPAASTMMACMGPNLEYKFFSFLENTSSYRIEGNLLYMSAGGQMQAVFEAIEKTEE